MGKSKKKKQQDVVNLNGNAVKLGTNVCGHSKKLLGECFTKVTKQWQTVVHKIQMMRTSGHWH